MNAKMMTMESLGGYTLGGGRLTALAAVLSFSAEWFSVSSWGQLTGLGIIGLLDIATGVFVAWQLGHRITSSRLEEGLVRKGAVFALISALWMLWHMAPASSRMGIPAEWGVTGITMGFATAWVSSIAGNLALIGALPEAICTLMKLNVSRPVVQRGEIHPPKQD